MLENLSIHHPYLYGLQQDHLINVDGILLESKTATAFAKMADAASKDGINISICSGFRSFTQQLNIWNSKAAGNRSVLDINSKIINITKLTDVQLMQAILLWSALPGASRHHWGTDIDVFDANHISKAKLKLIPDEYMEHGPCNDLYQWLIQNATDFGFEHPFQAGKSGVSPEPWHISYRPVSDIYLERFDINDFEIVISTADIHLKNDILKQLNQLVENYVYRIAF
ncbi:D-alanyl-D-alanine carboxypeptidase family protein [Parashewanella curva]|uniref:D-alanyl-D-alanine carboxypeptidase family protein n=1 Tax=Parashewanella curva TaxID=2338552 RepID=A0A3L8PV91_9GAMM|nr:M15 family metallopeptidase [Parashewanella curva]RLV59270.1 D-alanyl-D-alanine carboxypeptidase family protein [Parashewanella curva]